MNKVLEQAKAAGLYLLARFTEASTWAGTGAGFIILHQLFPGAYADKATVICASIAAILAILIPGGRGGEKK